MFTYSDEWFSVFMRPIIFIIIDRTACTSKPICWSDQESRLVYQHLFMTPFRSSMSKLTLIINETTVFDFLILDFSVLYIYFIFFLHHSPLKILKWIGVCLPPIHLFFFALLFNKRYIPLDFILIVCLFYRIFVCLFKHWLFPPLCLFHSQTNLIT